MGAIPDLISANKKISLFSATALSVTAMIGSGWLFSVQLNASLAGNYSFLAWGLAAALAMIVGLSLSQVVAVYPVRGATSRSSALSHNETFGMPFAFANWFGIMATISTEAQATTQYLSTGLKSQALMNDSGLTISGKIFALSILIIYLIINYYGVKLLAKVNNTITVVKVFTPLFTVVVLLIAHFDTTNFNLSAAHNYTAGSAISAIIGAGLIYAYNGFQLSTAFASEIENPKRNVPLSMIISIIIVMAIYMLLQLAFMGAIPHEMLSNGWTSLNFHSPLVNLALLLGAHFLAMVLIANSVISPSGTGYSFLGASARMFYAMAKEGQMPKWTISKLHPKYNICRRSLLINFAITAIILWSSQGWASLMVIVTGYHIIGYMAAPISMGAIKPKTRLAGLIIFIILGLITTTMPHHDLIMMNLSIMILIIIYGIVQARKHIALSALLILLVPFVAYLWLIYFCSNIYWVIILSAIFYLLVTHSKYVGFCKKTKSQPLSLVAEETDIA